MKLLKLKRQKRPLLQLKKPKKMHLKLNVKLLQLLLKPMFLKLQKKLKLRRLNLWKIPSQLKMLQLKNDHSWVFMFIGLLVNF